MKPIYLLSAITLGILTSSCATMDANRLLSAGTKAVQAISISDADIENYIGDYVAQLDAQNTIATGNDPYNVRLNRIAGAINNKDGINIKVYKTNEVNAFAVADGSVRVYSGLMDIMSDEEVLGVIGHEIGHVKLKHTKNAFKNALATSAILEGIGSTGQVAAALTDSQVGAIGQTLSESRFSQKQEYEADAYGYDFLKGHGINPWAMALSFEKLHELQGGSNNTGAIMQLFSTHPDIVKRTEKMVERATKDGFTRPANK